MEQKKKAFAVLLTIQLLLVALLLVSSIIFVATRPMELVCCIVSAAFVAIYAVTAYKKPHGNLLKYAMAVISLGMIITASYGISIGSNVFVMGCVLVCSALICYTTGRLDRIDENKIYFAIIEIVLLIVALYILFTHENYGFFYTVIILKYVIMFTTIMVAYFGRYKEHKEAGLNANIPISVD